MKVRGVVFSFLWVVAVFLLAVEMAWIAGNEKECFRRERIRQTGTFFVFF